MKLIIAGGGTGGHLFSGLSVAQTWKKEGKIVFVGTSSGLEKNLVPQYGFRLEFIRVSSFKGRGLFDKCKALVGGLWAVCQAFKLLRREAPDVVLGIGGYASGPTVLAACLKGIKTAVLDQNSIPGMTNRILGRLVNRVYLTFADSEKFFKKGKVRIFGNPIMENRKPHPLPSRDRGFLLNFPSPGGRGLGGGGNEMKHLLVCGGSQGAHVLNEKFLEGLDEITQKIPDLKITFQTGDRDFEWAKKEAGAGAVPVPNIEIFSFIDKIEEKYAMASLVVSRAGAGTLTELALWGLPAILVPYPFAADDHQRLNARAFVEGGAAEMMHQENLSGKLLAAKVVGLLNNPEKLKQMSENALKLARPNAARDVVEDLSGLVNLRPHTKIT